MNLLAHVTFRLQNVHTLNRQRLLSAVVLLAAIPVAVEIPALAAVAILAGRLTAVIAYDAIRFAEERDRVRHRLAARGCRRLTPFRGATRRGTRG